MNTDGIKILFDVDLIKQDLTNEFNIHKGEDITDPSRGAIMWDMLFEANTNENINKITEDCIRIFKLDSRVTLTGINVVAIKNPNFSGYVMEAALSYVGTNVLDVFTLTFNKSLTDTGV